MSTLWCPGQYVMLPDHPDWGPGQIQSVDGDRVTVNFEHTGKQLVRTDRITLREIPQPKEY